MSQIIHPSLPTLICVLIALTSGCKKETASSDGTPPATSAAPPATQAGAPVELENLGVGQMGRFDFDSATQTFAKLAAQTDDPDAQVNLAIATLNRQHEGDVAAAMKILDKVLVPHPDHRRARYCKGVLLLNGGQPAEALEQFRAVAAADPRDAYAAYYTGQSLAALGKHADAVEAYQRAIAIDPYLRSAYYGSFQSLQRLSRADDAKAQLEHFQNLKDHLQARLVEFKYTRMGSKAQAEVSPARVIHAPASASVGAVFADVRPLPLQNADAYPWDRLTERASITAADIDGDGSIDLFIAGGAAGPGRNAVLLRRGERFQVAQQHPLAMIADVNAVLWGDFDNNGLTDAYLLRRGGNQLWRQSEKGRWQNVTEPTQTAGGATEAINGAMFDADHDGDLDIFIVNQGAANELLNNNGNGTFRALGAETGLAGDGRPTIGVVVNDLDRDGDADVIVLHRQPPHEVHLNDRMWHYRKGAGLEQFLRAPVDAAMAADADADGQVELYTAFPQGLTQWSPDARGIWKPQPIGPAKSTAQDQHLAFADVDGNGALDLLHFDGNGFSAIELAPNYRQVFNAPAPVVSTCIIAMLDASRGPSVVGLPPRQPPVLWPPGEGRYPFFDLTLSGKQKAVDQMRSNASGIGVKLAARVDQRWTAVDTYPNQSGPGQSLQPVAIGLGTNQAADFVRLTWPDGLQQTELALQAGGKHRIEETQRQTSSCPVLFAWNGNEYAFVTDCLGVGGIGFLAAPGEFVPPRPWENLLLPEGLLKPLAGRYVVKLCEPMEEACYLDSASLVSWDLPPDWMMTLDERMGVSAPEPTGQPRFYRRQMAPRQAMNDRGQDITAAVSEADGRAAPPGEIDSRFIGLTHDHSVTLTFDRPLDEEPGEPMLIADGWIEYPYSQTMFAAWQAQVAYEAPTLEARGADGNWVVVWKHFGYPAGMPRQMSLPLPRQKIPPGTTQLRLRTNQEIYWDRLVVAWSEPCERAKRNVLPMKAARLAEVGFPTRITRPQRRPNYDYTRRPPLSDTRYQDGFYTALGSIDELVRQPDDALAIFGPGEETHLEFASRAEPLPPGWTRRLVLELIGWCKDRDFYTQNGQTLSPLPHRDIVAPELIHRRAELHQRFNTRFP